MIKTEMKNYNMTLTEQQQQYLHDHLTSTEQQQRYLHYRQVKLMNMSIRNVKKYCFS